MTALAFKGTDLTEPKQLAGAATSRQQWGGYEDRAVALLYVVTGQCVGKLQTGESCCYKYTSIQWMCSLLCSKANCA